MAAPPDSTNVSPAMAMNSASTGRSRARSALAQPRSTPDAATSSGIPASVIRKTAAVTVAVKATANSSQPATKM